MDNERKPYELIFVNDGSTDNSLSLLKDFQQKHPDKIIVIEFTRNYGQHAAIFAGFEQCHGEIIITIDADLQNPPEEIPKLINKIEEGFDVVGTIREDRKDSLFRKTGSFIINKITAKLTGVNLKDYGCMLRAYRREIVEHMSASKEISTFIPVLATAYAGRIAEIKVKHEERQRGVSKYNLFNLISLQFDLITSFSNLPLRLLIYLGFVVSFLGLGFSLFLGIRRLIVGPEVEGVFTLFAILFFFVGAQFLAFGLLGEYIGRIYSEVRKRPRFVIRQIYSKR
jgi:undecaprenyl-phosphate 4-deoxy-4-formamido-L-arabinose transferase